MADNNDQRTLEGLQVGMVYFARDGKRGMPVIQPGITAYDPKFQITEDRITADSVYIHKANSNSASLALSGSYGLSAVSQLQAGLSVSISRDYSHATDNLSVSMQRIVTAGIEYIDFNSLSPADFIAALKGASAKDDDQGTGPYLLMMDVINTYDAAMEAIAGKDTNAAVADEDLSEKLRNWASAKQAFFKEAGNLLLIAVLWGGWGGVRLSFTGTTEETLWKGGGKGRFSYGSATMSASVEAAYGHTELDETQKKEGRLDRFSHGECVNAMVDDWEKTLTKLLLDKAIDIGKTTVGSLPKPDLPSIGNPPELKKPDKPKELADRIDKIKDMKGLEALAKASAYDDYVRGCKSRGESPKSLNDFLADAESENDLSGLDDDILAFESDSDGESAGLEALDMTKSSVSPKPLTTGQAADPFANYIPVGAWFAPWSHIFPWLAEPQSNVVPKNSFSANYARLRLLQSDAASLARTYHHAAAVGATIEHLPYGFGDIARTFDTMTRNASELLRDFVSGPNECMNTDELQAQVKKRVMDHLTSPSRAIYDRWISTPALRECELGAGVAIHHGVPNNTSLRKIRQLRAPKETGPGTRLWYWEIFDTPEIAFDRETRDYSAFADAIKVIPVIIPEENGERTAITALINWVDEKGDPAAGFICASRKQPYGIFVARSWAYGTKTSKGNRYPPTTAHRHAVVFNNAGQNTRALVGRTLKGEYNNDAYYISLWPIPYSAAQNQDWVGFGNSYGMTDLLNQLKHLRGGLEDLNRISFGSEFWSGHDPNFKMISQNNLGPAYIGLIDEPKFF